jgi:hypothetical protein
MHGCCFETGVEQWTWHVYQHCSRQSLVCHAAQARKARHSMQATKEQNHALDLPATALLEATACTASTHWEAAPSEVTAVTCRNVLFKTVKRGLLTGNICPALKQATIHSGLTIGTGSLQQQQQQQHMQQANAGSISRTSVDRDADERASMP